jgi:Protein of unknown function (DUF1553)/Protein of unknown function (DUF1549)
LPQFSAVRNRFYIGAGIAGFFLMAVAGLRAGETSPPAVHWSFRPLAQQPLPKVSDPAWPKNRIDYFILSQMEKAGLRPAPPADDRVLLRRLYFDLTGLPPSLAAVDHFDQSGFSNTKVVEELLASPHYGERWGRHWLDLARYTDIPESWSEAKSPPFLYRDWVVAAFNADLPYDQFVIRQLANDLLPEARPEDNAALGFIGLSPSYWKELQLPPEIIGVTVAEEWEERVDALGQTFLGLTLACARCHDHKTAPVTAEDYYALAGVFASVQIADKPVVADALWKPVAAARAKVAALEKQRADLKKIKPAPADLKTQLTEIEKNIAEQKNTPHFALATASGVVEAALFVKEKKGAHGTTLEYVAGMAQDLALQRRGNPNDKGEVVPRRFLSAFPQNHGQPRPLKNGSGRLDLARALVEDAAPLSARVIVNRVWQHHFGRGLVETPSEFGPAGEAPTHPELLDDLAARFVENGWSIKWLHREILTSATWQQASLVPPESEARDPANQHYSRMARRRLDFEAWRDAMLAATGELDLKVGGEPFNLDDARETRRTLYGKVQRRELSTMLSVNDFPDPIAHSAARTETSTPLQQLFSLNGPFVMQRARALADQLGTGASPDEQGRIRRAYALLLQREPTPREEDLGLAFLKRGGSLAGYSQVLLTGNEFLYMD